MTPDQVRRCADAVIAAAADYRTRTGLPTDAPLIAGIPDPAAAAVDELRELLAPHHIATWRPRVDVDPATVVGGGVATFILWSAERVTWHSERTDPIDLSQLPPA